MSLMRVASHKNCRARTNGFTIMELLVVLVILSLVTTLLLSSLSVIWKSFERLEQKQLNQSANLAAYWFRKTLEGAVQYHPHHSAFSGTSNVINLISINAIDTVNHSPTPITWQIVVSEDQYNEETYTLRYSNGISNTSFDVYKSSEPLSFIYTDENNKRTSRFLPKLAVLPHSVSISKDKSVGNNQLWVVAIPKNKGKAEVPVEMAMFGKYEF